jgi:proteasome lid subunit RPN8/RPN11
VTPWQIAPAAVNVIVAHAAAEAPDECCGLLIGREETVLHAVRARNLRARDWRHRVGAALRAAGLPIEPAGRRRYLLDPRDHIAGMKKARALGLSVIGVYHSHPKSAPAPSETDLREATYPDYLYVIVSPGYTGDGPRMRGYILEGRRFTEVRLVRE